MGLGKQAKILTPAQEKQVLFYLETTRNPLRNKLVFLLTMKAGLRAKEVANLTWGMILDASGNLAECISLENKASKGLSGGKIPLNEDLKMALLEYLEITQKPIDSNERVIKTERSKATSAQVIVNLLCSIYKCAGLQGSSSHSGRRSFITRLAKKITNAGGSIRDVQLLARHSSLQMTQRYIEHDAEAIKKVIQMI